MQNDERRRERDEERRKKTEENEEKKGHCIWVIYILRTVGLLPGCDRKRGIHRTHCAPAGLIRFEVASTVLLAQ